MADKPKMVRGTLNGATVEIKESTAGVLGAQFTPEKAAAKKAAAKPDDK